MLKVFALFILLLMLPLGAEAYSPFTYFTADKTPIVLKLDSGSGVFSQGKTAILYFTGSKPGLDIRGDFQGKDFKSYPYGKKYRVVLGFSIDDPGDKDYLMKMKVSDGSGSADYYYNVHVGSTKFETLRFTLKPKKVHMLMPDTIREDWKNIEDIVVEENNVDYINGPFIKPTAGHVSMAFGVREYINGEESGRHRGLDFANKLGAPVWASNNGVVRLAKLLPAHGNCVVIEHGEGLFTYYAHLSKILVKPGDFVKKGQNIGLVGMTGVATGPHLHFAMNVHNLRVDPMQWLQGVVKD
jgi:Peptidase family M23